MYICIYVYCIYINSLKQCTYPGVLTGENDIGAGTKPEI